MCSLILKMATMMEKYPLISYLAQQVLTVPITNAWPERDASCLKWIKKRLRNRISNDLLQANMTVSLNGPKLGSEEAKNLLRGC